MISESNKELVKLLFKYLHSDQDALMWVLSYGIYCHAIDDIIDGDKTDYEHILKTFDSAAVLFSSPFYQRNIALLYPLVKAASNSYADSVKFERDSSAPDWKRNYADVLRQQANEVICASIEIVAGVDARREISPILRERSYRAHHNELGQAI